METKSDFSEKKSLPKKSENHWSKGLLKAMKNPKLIVFEDKLTVTIKDCYPKAKFHYLVCLKEDISTLKVVKFQHLGLLKHMHCIAEKLCSRHKVCNFLIGYHSEPSMERLHLHVISDDFDSPCLKTKKHWNSFTTEFFIPSEKIIKQLETKGHIIFKSLSESKILINQPLKCHKCEYIPKHMPDLKHHLKIHLM